MKKKIILLVEDDPNDIDLTKRAFKKSKITEDIKIIVAHDGFEALNYLNGNSRNKDRITNFIPKIILLDLNLPKMTGLELLKHIRANKKSELIPVVILSSSKEEQDIVNAYKLGANSYIRKPVDFKKFSSVAQQLGSYWVGLNEPLP
ncbi:MAG: response regulator [Thermoplasmatales archaeon]|nr:MAG: response regulator [Thermoplasmatales archaeon]